MRCSEPYAHCATTRTASGTIFRIEDGVFRVCQSELETTLRKASSEVVPGFRVEDMNDADTHDCIIVGAGELAPYRAFLSDGLTLCRAVWPRSCQNLLGTPP